MLLVTRMSHRAVDDARGESRRRSAAGSTCCCVSRDWTTRDRGNVCSAASSSPALGMDRRTRYDGEGPADARLRAEGAHCCGGLGSALVATSDPDATCVRTPWNASLARCERASGRTDVCVCENEPIYGMSGTRFDRSSDVSPCLHAGSSELPGESCCRPLSLSRCRHHWLPREIANREHGHACVGLPRAAQPAHAFEIPPAHPERERTGVCRAVPRMYSMRMGGWGVPLWPPPIQTQRACGHLGMQASLGARGPPAEQTCVCVRMSRYTE